MASAADCQRAFAPGAERSVAVWAGGALTGEERSVIVRCVSHGTFASSGGRWPPGGRPGWTPTILVSDWPNRPGWSE